MLLAMAVLIILILIIAIALILYPTSQPPPENTQPREKVYLFYHNEWYQLMSIKIDEDPFKPEGDIRLVLDKILDFMKVCEIPLKYPTMIGILRGALPLSWVDDFDLVCKHRSCTADYLVDWLIEYQKGKFAQKMDQKKTKRKRSKCNYCDKFGHSESMCFRKKDDNNICSVCDQKGHVSREHGLFICSTF
eukprot:TRINITY_DN7003_c0_g1_i1.p1 TRINITY_DN7003_c0_g1~~TRINITY_DN7003_c0_g1_i1.p1  ORF type:complete len:191 (-),score=21.33 TRINITY_DN7003_c0_g1_i1:379-951(-)